MWSLDPRARVSRHLWQFLERAPQSDLINNITIVRTQKREKYEIKPKSSIATGHSVKWPLLIMRTCAISGSDCVSDTFEQNDPGTLLFFDLHVPHTWNSRTIAQYKWPFHLRFGSNKFFRSSYQPNTTHSFCFVVCKEFSGGIPGCLLSRAINRGVCPFGCYIWNTIYVDSAHSRAHIANDRDLLARVTYFFCFSSFQRFDLTYYIQQQ